VVAAEIHVHVVTSRLEHVALEFEDDVPARSLIDVVNHDDLSRRL
jgi:hypothetical protein